MLRLHQPTPDHVQALLTRWQDEPLSYTPTFESGFIADDHAVCLGAGATIYRRACAALDDWWMFPTWAVVHRQRAQTPGDVVAMVVQICGLWWINPCRILRRYDSERTHGFTYGTLPEHAESGEELFGIEHRFDDTVWYVIRAFSRPRHWMAWLGFPLARWWQCRFVRDSQARMKNLPPAKVS